jgi:hypothetical protein
MQMWWHLKVSVNVRSEEGVEVEGEQDVWW